MEYNFSIPLFSYEENKDAETTEGNKVTLDRVLATQLASANSTTNTIKYMCWAIDLYNGKPLNLDEVDSKLLKEFIEKDQMLINLVKYQLLKVLENREQK